jgi:2-polyprenyl-3-methyl-5-hydroxy-6-metoxy-1,4-benzoquinol methylase
LSVQTYFERIAHDFDSYYDEPKGGFSALTNRLLRKPPILRRLRLAMEAVDRPEVGSILDIGCGSGVLSIPMTQRGKRVTAADFSAPMIEIAKEKARRAGVEIDFRLGDFMTADLPTADATVALGVMEYFADVKPLVARMLALTNPGGVAAFDVPSAFNLHTPMRIPYLVWRRRRAYFYAPWELEGIVGPFRDQIASAAFHPYGAGWLVVLRKK